MSSPMPSNSGQSSWDLQKGPLALGPPLSLHLPALFLSRGAKRLARVMP